MVKAEPLGVECYFLVCWLADTRCSDMVKAETLGVECYFLVCWLQIQEVLRSLVICQNVEKHLSSQLGFHQNKHHYKRICLHNNFSICLYPCINYN
jgi:hypothetical protein